MWLPGRQVLRSDPLQAVRRARAAPVVAVAAFAFGSTLFAGIVPATPAGPAPPSAEDAAPSAPRRELYAAAAQAVSALAAAPRPDPSAVTEQRASMPPVAPSVEAGSDAVWEEFLVHFPPRIEGRLPVLVALHGMEGNGPAFQAPLREQADRAGWVLVAPTFDYGDWQDPAQLVREAKRFLPRLNEFLQGLPARTGLAYESRVAIYGASRGGQLAHRFAYVFPERTRAVAVFAPGSYTLPLEAVEANGHLVPLPYPYGTADLEQLFGHALDRLALQRVAFWVGIGDADRDPADVPRQWDPYLGDNRLTRAQAFAGRIAATGASVELAVFPGLGHALSDEMQRQALEFLARER